MNSSSTFSVPCQVALHFGVDKMTFLRQLAASVIAKYAQEAANSGVRMGELDLWPALWVTPVRRLSARFRLGDYSCCILKAYYEERAARA